MATAEQLLTADEFLARPEGPREELIDGRLVLNEPGFQHQAATLNIIVALRRWVEDEPGHGCVSLPLNLRISDRDVLAPDALWYADLARVDADSSAQHQPPDLVVEVRSPSTWTYDIGLKRERYERWGVRELWLVDTESRSVLVHRRSQAAAPVFDVAFEVGEPGTLTSPLLPGLGLGVSAIFAMPGGPAAA